jgi:hypothetical protein
MLETYDDALGSSNGTERPMRIFTKARTGDRTAEGSGATRARNAGATPNIVESR